MPPDTSAVAASWKRESDVARDSRPDIVALHGMCFLGPDLYKIKIFLRRDGVTVPRYLGIT